MMIGFDVAPVAPKARLTLVKSGSTLSSHNLVPVAISDSKGVVIVGSLSLLRSAVLRAGCVLPRACGLGYNWPCKQASPLLVLVDCTRFGPNAPRVCRVRSDACRTHWQNNRRRAKFYGAAQCGSSFARVPWLATSN